MKILLSDRDRREFSEHFANFQVEDDNRIEESVLRNYMRTTNSFPYHKLSWNMQMFLRADLITKVSTEPETIIKVGKSAYVPPVRAEYTPVVETPVVVNEQVEGAEEAPTYPVTVRIARARAKAEAQLFLDGAMVASIKESDGKEVKVPLQVPYGIHRWTLKICNKFFDKSIMTVTIIDANTIMPLATFKNTVEPMPEWGTFLDDDMDIRL